MRPAFFFDRDGVVNCSPGEGYVLSWEQFVFSKGIRELLSFLKSRGFVLVLVTSQQGVGRGLMSQATLDDIHARMQAELHVSGAAFDAIYTCTCLAEDPACTCRKPNAEMVLRAAREHDLDLSCSWLVGDHDRDIRMAIHAGVPHTIRVRGHYADGVKAEHTVAEVSEVLPLLREWLAA